MAGWTHIKNLIVDEEKQLIEEGVVPGAVTAARVEAQRRLDAGANEAEVWAPFSNLPTRSDFAFVEPSGLAAIKALRPGGGPKLSFDLSDSAVLLDKMHGAWLGRCAGCALGKPVETFMGSHNGIESWDLQKRYLTAISPAEWPLKDYFPKRSPAEAETGRIYCPASTREEIAYMETDDDIRYTVLGQIVLAMFGRNFTSTHVANQWMDKLPYAQVCTAETQAYRNMVATCDGFRGWGLNPQRAAELDVSTDWHYLTHHLNPYREWIGAQIRIDSYGYGAPGDPELAAEFAWRDARISHVKNGIYGAMFCAAMIAAAFATRDPMAIVEAGLAQIPGTSRLYTEMRQVIEICAKYKNDFAHFEDVIRDIYAILGHYSPVHTNNNAGICVAAVLLSGGNFHKGITFAVMGGWDTDCNGATVGSIVGALNGASGTPAHWSGRLNDTLKSLIIEYHPIAISECARRSAEIAVKVRKQA